MCIITLWIVLIRGGYIWARTIILKTRYRRRLVHNTLPPKKTTKKKNQVNRFMAVQDDHDSSPPLYEVISLKSYPKRLVEVFVLFLLILLLVNRILSYDRNSALVHRLAFSCEAWFALVWLVVVSTKWTPIHNKTYPERLLERYKLFNYLSVLYNVHIHSKVLRFRNLGSGVVHILLRWFLRIR